MRTLRLDGESEGEFRKRVEKAARYATILVEACLANDWVQELIQSPDFPLWSEAGCQQNPTVRVEYEQAVAFGGIGETLEITKSKHWGSGPYIHPLKKDDWFYPERISYLYRENSLYNRRYEQRRRMKELLGKRYRSLVETAKSRYTTKKIFLQNLTDDQANAIRRILKCEPGAFWQAAKGRRFVDLPPRLIQQDLDFGNS